MDLLNTYARYDDESGEWQIKYIALSGNNIAQTRRITEGNKTNLESADEQISDENLNSFETGNRAYTRPDPFIRLKDLVK